MKTETATPQKYNLHTHTFRCKHAEGDAVDYAGAAAEAGAELLGFTEHPPLKPEELWTPFRIEEEDIDDYFDAVELARNKFPEMRILTGFEMDLYPTFRSYYEDTFLHRSEIDFLVGGVHWFRHQGEWMWVQKADTASHLRAYFNEILGLMESGMMSFITHPDSFALGYLCWDENAEACSRDILSAAEEYRIPLEINGYGLRRPDIATPEGPRKAYPLMKFWELAAEYDIGVVCNTDAHRPEDAMAGLEDCHEIISRFGLNHLHADPELPDLFLKDKVLNR